MAACLTPAECLLLLDCLRHTVPYGGLGPATRKPQTLPVIAAHLLSSARAPTDAASRRLAASLCYPASGAAQHFGAAAAAGGASAAVLNALQRDAPPARPLDAVLRDLSAAFAAVCAAVLRRGGHEVDYASVGRTEAWGDWLVAADALRSAVPGEMDDSVRKAGLFNLYNGLVIHAKLVYGHPTSLAKRGTFFNSAAYVVCGVRVSSADLEHQVLRCKATGKSVFAPLRLAVKDPRMHFVLNCGARSCPPVRPIRCDEAEEDIVAATVYFIRKHVTLEGTKVTLSRLWKWFHADFTPESTRTLSLLAWISGNAPPDVREKLLPLLSAMGGKDDMDGGEVEDETPGSSADVKSEQPLSPKNSKIRIKFQRYDWADNGDWDAPRDDNFMHIYDASFALNK